MSMYFYLKARTAEKSRYSIVFFIFCFLAGLAAILTKENAIMLPFCIIIFDFILISGATSENLKKYLKYFTLPIIVLITFTLVHVDFKSILNDYHIRSFTMIERLLTEPRILIFYLALLFYPINSRLTLLYDIDLSTSLFHPWSTLPAIFCILLLILAAVYLAKKYPLISFCIIFFFLNHIVESSFIALELIFEHRNYLPAMLLFILPSILIINVLDYFSYKKTIQFACVIGVIIILTGLGDITYRRNTIISNEFNLWFDNIEKYPKLSRTHSNLGNFYLIKELKPQALHEYEKAMVLNNFGSINARAFQEHNLGLYYFNEGKYDLALSYFERSYEVIPSFPPNSIHIAEIRLLKNEYPQAHRFIESELNKYSPAFNLTKMFCLILLKENNFTDAALYASKMLINDPSGYFPLSVLAETSRHKGNFQSAISFWKLYQQSLPLDSYANLALIELYAQTNNFKLLDQELAKLYCLKKNQTLFSYIKEISRNKNLLVYTPDWGRIKKIVEKRNRVF
jgi:protein O-mannosyl-transferase